MNENGLSYHIRGAIFAVYKTLGPGLLESVYEMALLYELTLAGFDVKCQVPLPVVYKNVRLKLGFRLDLLVNGLVVIEIKSVERLMDVHHKQLLSYLRLADKRLGILVNFNTEDIDKCIFRKVNKL